MPEDLPDRDELLDILGKRARDGNVQAAKLLLEELRREDDGNERSGFDALDEVAARREQKSA